MNQHAPTTQDFLSSVRQTIFSTLEDTLLNRNSEIDLEPLVSGKMLRAQLLHTLGCASGLPRENQIAAAAAVEMLHAASLLHDDVVDEGKLRRGAPALWVTHGPKVAVLTGDMLLSLAFSTIAEIHPHAVPALSQTLRSMCEAEIEQESRTKEEAMSLDDCIRIASGKTGSLFGFSAYAAAPSPSPAADALMTAGTQLGIAYQLADDLLDLRTNESVAGKTLGTDAASGKYTVANIVSNSGQSPKTFIQPILDQALQELENWPKLQKALGDYIHETLQPLMDTYYSAEENSNAALAQH